MTIYLQSYIREGVKNLSKIEKGAGIYKEEAIVGFVDERNISIAKPKFSLPKSLDPALTTAYYYYYTESIVCGTNRYYVLRGDS